MRYAISFSLMLGVGAALVSVGCSKSTPPSAAATDVRPPTKLDAEAARSVGLNTARVN
jgi:hypothetical protein